MIPIYIDNIIFSLQKHGGVSVLWGELIKKILISGVDSYFMDFRNANDNQVRQSISIPDSKLIIGNKRPIIWERYINPIFLESSPFLFHSSHYRVSNNSLATNITTVHDFTYEYYFKGMAKKIHCWQKYQAIRNSSIIICISENTKKDLLHFLPDISEDKIRIIYNGVSVDYFPLLDSNPFVYDDYLLFVGGRHSYKNFSFAVECVKSIGKKLLVVGSKLSDYETGFLEKELGKDGFKSIVHPSNEYLNKLYNSVNCLLYPSLYEGFGIPVIEAQKAGCPVIAMNSSSIPEIIGNKTTLLNSSNTSEFKDVYNILQVNRKDLILEGFENAKKYSWDKMTREYINVYKELQK